MDSNILIEAIGEQCSALLMGFSCIPDKSRGDIWCQFAKNNIRVWKIREGWQTATLENGIFTNHKTFPTLGEALKRSL
jgi:hypothetical protein